MSYLHAFLRERSMKFRLCAHDDIYITEALHITQGQGKTRGHSLSLSNPRTTCTATWKSGWLVVTTNEIKFQNGRLLLRQRRQICKSGPNRPEWLHACFKSLRPSESEWLELKPCPHFSARASLLPETLPKNVPLDKESMIEPTTAISAILFPKWSCKVCQTEVSACLEIEPRDKNSSASHELVACIDCTSYVNLGKCDSLRGGEDAFGMHCIIPGTEPRLMWPFRGILGESRPWNVERTFKAKSTNCVMDVMVKVAKLALGSLASNLWAGEKKKELRIEVRMERIGATQPPTSLELHRKSKSRSSQ